MSLWDKLRNTLRPANVDREIAEEIDFHRAMAARDSNRTVGNAIYWQEETRQVRLLPWLESVLQDARYGLRELGRDKGFTATAILSLSLGILAATSMYSVIYGVVIEPFPYRDVDNLVSIEVRGKGERYGKMYYNVDEYATFAARATVFEGLAASTISDVLWINNSEPLRLRGNHISHNGFEVMGVPAMLGRIVTAKEENPETKAVLGHRFWIRQFGGSLDVLGSTMILNGKPRTVVGVMPPRFMFRGADVYLPTVYRRGESPEGVTGVHITGRRRAGVSDAQAQADLDPIVRDLAKESPAQYPPNWSVSLRSFKQSFPSSIRNQLWIMFGAVGLLLLIACANVSNLLLARAATRQREIAMRAALGAGRRRLFRQLLTESALLGVMGTLLGIAGSWTGLKAILAVVPQGVIPDEAEVVLNLPVLGFSAAISMACVLLFGLAPALHATGVEPAQPLREAGRSTSGSRRMNWFRSSLVVVELSLAVILLAGAALSLHTLVRLYQAPLAVGVDNRLVARIPLRAARYPNAESRTAFLRHLLDRLRETPGVLGVGINTGIHPLGSWRLPVEIPGEPNADSRPVPMNQVNEGYLQATGIQLRRGRWLDAADIASQRHVAVVNETFAKRYFGGVDPLGKTVRMPRLKQPPFSLQDDHFEIAGIVQDALHELHNNDPYPEIYMPYSLTGLAEALVVHTAGDPMAMAKHIRAHVQQMDGSQFVDETRTLASLMDLHVYSRGRFYLWLIGVFAALGLLLAVIGIYGLLSQVVSSHRQEYSIRMAVGAGFGQIVRLVLLRGMKLIAIGLAAGIIIAVVLLPRVGWQLDVHRTYDPLSLGGAAMVLVLAGVAGCLIPAARAGRTNPVEALR
ncbi:MAG: ABC transporter permease [Acidobacteria bacterium]|nr:ABC transporter permease [Acidobacteriota bacterium]